MLQTWLITGLGELGEQAKPAEWERQGPQDCHWAGTCSPEGPRSPGEVASPAGYPGRIAVPAAGATLSDEPPAPPPLGQVEISPFKPARSNQGPARPPVQTRAATSLQLPPGRHRRGGG